MKIELEIEPFQTPNFVRLKSKPRPRQEGFQETPPIPLKDLALETLEELCKKFREDVMIKAGKGSPVAEENAAQLEGRGT